MVKARLKSASAILRCTEGEIGDAVELLHSCLIHVVILRDGLTVVQLRRQLNGMVSTTGPSSRTSSPVGVNCA